MPDYTSIIERLEKAEGPVGDDDELIWMCCRAFMDRADYSSFASLFVIALGPGIPALGAAVALIKRLLPNWAWQVSSRGEACIWQHHGNIHPADAATPALAILLALFKALAAKEEAK